MCSSDLGTGDDSMVDVGAGRVANEWVLPVHAIKGFNLSADNRYLSTLSVPMGV